MSTVREVVSRVRSMNKLISSDSFITDRVIYAELKSKASLFIKREVDKRKLWASSNIFTTLPCVELKTVPISECCEFLSDVMVARSKIKLPKIGEGNYGFLIQAIHSTELSSKLIEVTPSRYTNLLKLNSKTTSVYYWIHNQYLYISDPRVKLISVSAYFEEDVSSDMYKSLCNCAGDTTKSDCVNPLDQEFKAPGYLEDNIVGATYNVLLQTYFKIPRDHTQDNKDDQVNKV